MIRVILYGILLFVMLALYQCIAKMIYNYDKKSKEREKQKRKFYNVTLGFPRKNTLTYSNKTYRAEGNEIGGIVEGDNMSSFGLKDSDKVFWKNADKLETNPDLLIGEWIILKYDSDRIKATNPLADVNTHFEGKLIRKMVGYVNDLTKEDKSAPKDIAKAFMSYLLLFKKDGDTFDYSDILKDLSLKFLMYPDEKNFVITIKDKKPHILSTEIYPFKLVEGKVIKTVYSQPRL